MLFVNKTAVAGVGLIFLRQANPILIYSDHFNFKPIYIYIDVRCPKCMAFLHGHLGGGFRCCYLQPLLGVIEPTAPKTQEKV